MFFTDEQRTFRRRSSSLIVKSKIEESSTVRTNDKGGSKNFTTSQVTDDILANAVKPCTVEDVYVTLLYESLLQNIATEFRSDVCMKTAFTFHHESVDEKESKTSRAKSAKTLPPKVGKAGVKGKQTEVEEQSVAAVVRLESSEGEQTGWNYPDENVFMRFQNGNKYEGRLSRKYFHGLGKFTWADGSSYLGRFEFNKMMKSGTLEWPDQSWYEGEIYDGFRHGTGVFVTQGDRSYSGQWYLGKKHGKGLMFYSNTSYYVGDWNMNSKDGFGKVIYGDRAYYKGQYVNDCREGRGVMVWPNSDYYDGSWKNGIIDGVGKYVWSLFVNPTLTIPPLNYYKGFWENGKRTNTGILQFGNKGGVLYEGEFLNDLKHGDGILFCADGTVITGAPLFESDYPYKAPIKNDDYVKKMKAIKDIGVETNPCPVLVHTVDERICLDYHVARLISKLKMRKDLSVLRRLMEDGQISKPDLRIVRLEDAKRMKKKTKVIDNDSLVTRAEEEEKALRNIIRTTQKTLRDIYRKYATLSNSVEIKFEPAMMRMFLWQFYRDCGIHKKGITLVEIDKILQENPFSLVQETHYPFEKILFWQFMHSLLDVSWHLYARENYNVKDKNTVLADAFWKLMTEDIVPSTISQGLIFKHFKNAVPLQSMYKLYTKIGNPPTIADFVKSTRSPMESVSGVRPEIVDIDDKLIGEGEHVMIGNDIIYKAESPVLKGDNTPTENKSNIILFNLGNLSCSDILRCVESVSPYLRSEKIIVNMFAELTFLEFYEIMIRCIDQSLRASEKVVHVTSTISQQVDKVKPKKQSPKILKKGKKS